LALDAVPGGGDLLDVPGLHLLAKERVGHGCPLLTEHRGREQPVDNQEDEDDPPDSAEDPRPLPRRRPVSARCTCALPPPGLPVITPAGSASARAWRPAGC